MIPLSLPWLVFAGLFVFLAAILTLWAGYAMTRGASDSRNRRKMRRCLMCGSEFPAAQGLQRCPDCGELNEPNYPHEV